MIRRWQTWRVLVATLLLVVAAFAFWVWPRSPLWRVPWQSVRGVDERRGLVFLQYHGESKPAHVNTYDLSTGQFLVRATFQHRYFTIAQGGDLLALNSFDLDNDDADHIDLFALPNGELLRRFKVSGHDGVQAMALSADSKLLAKCGNAGYIVWDVRSGNVLHELKVDLSKDPSGKQRPKHWRAYLAVSNDGRFLGHINQYGDLLLLDLKSSREIGRIPNVREASFSEDGITVLVRSTDDACSAHLFRIVDGQLQTRSLVDWTPATGEFVVGANLNVVVTTRQRVFRLPFHESLPKGLVATIERWMGAERWDLTFRDVRTGAILAQPPISVEGEGVQRGRQIVGPPIVAPSFSVRLLDQGRRVFLQRYQDVALWDIRPGRTVMNWIVCGAMALVAVWMGWPRRAGVVAGTHAKA
jgi:hypothetical protein